MEKIDFDIYYKKNINELLSFAKGICKDSEIANDLVSSAYLSALKGLHNFDKEKGEIKHWIGKIIYRQYLQTFKHKKRFVSVESFPDWSKHICISYNEAFYTTEVIEKEYIKVQLQEKEEAKEKENEEKIIQAKIEEKRVARQKARELRLKEAEEKRVARQKARELRLKEAEEKHVAKQLKNLQIEKEYQEKIKQKEKILQHKIKLFLSKQVLLKNSFLSDKKSEEKREIYSKEFCKNNTQKYFRIELNGFRLNIELVEKRNKYSKAILLNIIEKHIYFKTEYIYFHTNTLVYKKKKDTN